MPAPRKRLGKSQPQCARVPAPRLPFYVNLLRQLSFFHPLFIRYFIVFMNLGAAGDWPELPIMLATQRIRVFFCGIRGFPKACVHWRTEEPFRGPLIIYSWE